MAARARMIGFVGVAAVLAAAMCVSSSVVAANINSEPACTSTAKGKNAYHWAWATAVTGGITTGVCVAGIAAMIFI